MKKFFALIMTMVVMFMMVNVFSGCDKVSTSSDDIEVDQSESETQDVQGTTGTQDVQGTTETQDAQGTTGAQDTTKTQGTQGVTKTQGAQGVSKTQSTKGTTKTQSTKGTTKTQSVQDTTGNYPILAERDYPMDSIVPLNGTIANADNKYISSTDYRGAIINVEDMDFNKVTITKRAGAETMGYTFLAKELKVGYSPSYATGYTRVIWDKAEKATLTIPENARYLYVYNNSLDNYMLPAAIKFIKTGETPTVDKNAIRIAIWNIGHFSMGGLPDSSIKDANFAASAEDYKDYIYNAVNADVLALAEYSAKFTPSNLAKTTLFSGYNTAFEGKQSNYSCNALYSRVAISNIQQKAFECNKTAGPLHTSAIAASDYYYITADLTINGQTVKLVSTHLAFNSRLADDTVNKNQIKELIELYKSYDKVVMIADWNVKKFSYFNLFTKAGYKLANTDETLYTYANSNQSLDNIVYKGVNVSDLTLAGTNLSDHYAIYCTVSVK